MSPSVRRAAAPAVDREMSDLGAERKVRFGLGSKFTLPVSIVVALVIVLMGTVVYSSTADSLDRQLNQQGVFAARIAAAPEIDSWDLGYNTVGDLQGRLAKVDAELALAGGSDTSMENPELTPERVKAIRETIAKHDDSQRLYNAQRLRRILGGEKNAATKGPGIYLDLWILNAAGESKVTASKEAKGYQVQDRFMTPSSPETEIETGSYVGRAGSEPARFFSHPIRDRLGKTVGKAVVVFSERGIRSDLDDLKNNIMLFCILGILAAAACAYITSKIITRPLGLLMRDIKSVAGGDLQHRTRPHSNDEIGSLASAFDHMTRNLSQAEEMRVDLAEKEHQVSVAHEVQERLFPKALPSSDLLALDAANRLADELSADLFDARVLSDGRIGALVMTASGRGIPAAIVLSMARMLFQSRGLQEPTPADALKAINSLLSPDLRRGMYVSALYAMIDPNTGEGTLASAGHRVPALHYVAAEEGMAKIQADGIAIGLDKGPVFDRSLTEKAFTLAPGDRLILATEGAFLLQDADGQALGEDAFMRVALAGSKKSANANAILNAIEKRLGATPGDHDITLVIAQRP